jgi:zinc transport system substrate-binding protein
MKKRLLVLVLILLIIPMGLGCSLFTSKNNQETLGVNEIMGKPVIQITTYPLYYFTTRIAGDTCDVHNFIPLGVEPHGWEPKPSDLVKLEEADVLIYNGAGFEDWLVNLSNSVKNPGLVEVNSTEGIELLKDREGQNQEDPHVWLDPLRAQEMALNIKNALVELYPENQKTLEDNYKKLAVELEQLHHDYREALADISKKEIIVTHNAFGYLAERYGLKQIPIMGVDAHAEPTPGKFKEIIQLAKEQDIKHVFAEVMVSSKVIETLANEADLKIEILNPLGNITQEDLDNGKDYFQIMYENLEVLKKALK